MEKVTLKFRKSDFNSSYVNSYDCAITKALARAGYPHLRDCGTYIKNGDRYSDTYELEVSEPKTHRKLHNKVAAMYKSKSPDLKFRDENGNSIKPIEPRAFQITILLDV